MYIKNTLSFDKDVLISRNIKLGDNIDEETTCRNDIRWIISISISLSLSLSLSLCSFSLFCLPVLNNYSAHQIDIVLYCAQAVIFTRKGKFNYFWRKSIIRNANKINNQRQLQNEYKQLSYDSLSYFLFKLLILRKCAKYKLLKRKKKKDFYRSSIRSSKRSEIVTNYHRPINRSRRYIRLSFGDVI